MGMKRYLVSKPCGQDGDGTEKNNGDILETLLLPLCSNAQIVVLGQPAPSGNFCSLKSTSIDCLVIDRSTHL